MANNYGLFFSKKNGEDGIVLHLPINPEKLPVARDSANEDKNVLGIGPIMVPRIPNLKTVTISSYFPGRIDAMTLTAGDFEKPEFYIRFFENAMLEKTVLTYTAVRYYENGESFFTDAGMDCLVTSFSYEERGGETGDFYYDLEITEYRDYAPLTIQIKEGGTAGAPATAVAEQTRDIPQGQLYVGAQAIVNGKYCYSSGGEEPHGNGNGRKCVVSRIVEGKPYPIHIKTESGGALGWCKKEALQVVSKK